MASGQSMDGGNGASSIQRNYVAGNATNRDYDGLKQQCDKAMSELSMLKRQHSETSRRCDHAMKELEYYRGQHRAAMNQLEASAQDSVTLRTKYADLANDKQRLERDVQDLRKKLNETDEYSTQDNGNVDNMFVSLSRRSASTEDSCESIRKRYEELLAAHSSAVAKLELSQEEVTRLKKQCEEFSQDRITAIREISSLKQQCSASIRQWDLAVRKQNEYKEALNTAQAQREEVDEELKQAMTVRMKASKDIKRLTDERNAAMQEYALIMSERDTVHKEMEKLSDDLTQALKKTKNLELANKQITDEKQTLTYQMETLKREIASSLHDRDKALKECNDLREKFGGLAQSYDNSRDSSKNRIEYVSHTGENPSGRKEVTGSGDLHNFKTNKNSPNTLDQATQEIQSLRKTLDEMRVEVTEATQEAEVSKRRRDWAFSERDKIVLERESIRTLCDRLRKERDRAISDLAVSLKEVDGLKKVRGDLCRELAKYKKIVGEMDDAKSVEDKKSVASSREFAFDTDTGDWITEVVDIDLTRLSSNSSLGLDLIGGSDDPQRPNDTGIFVSSIVPGSVTDGKLRVNDCIIRVNHMDCATRVSRRMVLEAIRSSIHRAHLVVRRKRSASVATSVSSFCSVDNHETLLKRMSSVDGKVLRTTQLAPSHHGLSLETGIFISKIAPGSLAAKNGTLGVGDRVLNINQKSMDGLKSSQEAMAILNDERSDIITITTMSNQNLNMDHSYFPTKEFHHSKMVNSCSQTEDFQTFKQHVYGSSEFEKRYSVQNSFGHGTVYKVSKTGPGSEKSISGTWDIIREKFDMVRGRRNSKDRNRSSEDKKKYRNSSPNPLGLANAYELEQDSAIAELDSVIDSYHRKTNSSSGSTSGNQSGNIQQTSGIPGVLKRSKRRGKDKEDKEKEKNNNSGTWPKARANVISNASGTGTVTTSIRKKERAPLSMFLADSSYKYDSRPDSKQYNAYCCVNDRSAKLDKFNYKSIDSSGHLSQNFGSESSANRLSLNSQAMLDNRTIDYSLKTKPIEQEIFDYYAKKNSGKTLGSNSLSPVKYPSDTESTNGPDSLTSVMGAGIMGSNTSAIGMNVMGLPVSNPNVLNSVRPQSQLYNMAPRYPHFFPSAAPVPPPVHHPHPHPHPHLSRLPSSQSGESFCFEPVPNASSHCHHGHSPSENSGLMLPPPTSISNAWQYRQRSPNPLLFPSSLNSNSLPIESGTFPRKRENQRFRIPSNPSVASSSIDRTSERASPMLPFNVEFLNTGRDKKTWNLYTKPEPGEIRTVYIEKTAEPLGIQIQCLNSGGVFVSTVNENSLASQAGLQIGDQLLEVCGINMRSATYQLAASVLRQCGNSISMLVQYSPEKYNELENSVSESSSDEDDELDDNDHVEDNDEMDHHVRSSSSNRDESNSRSDKKQSNIAEEEEEPTPRNTPRAQRKLSTTASTGGTLTRSQISHAVTTLHRQNNGIRHQHNEIPLKQSPQPQMQTPTNTSTLNEARYLFIETRKCSNLGISLVGGNAVGIFVHSVQSDSLAYQSGLRTGDQILKYNGADLRNATAEEAAYELAKPADEVSVLAQYNGDRYNEIKDKPGDSFYVRCGFDRNSSESGASNNMVDGSLQLSFQKDEVLYVDNTMFNGVPGHWRAWKLDSEGRRMQCGIIPSKYKVEEELLLRRSVGDLDGRGSTSARRSFFRRKKHPRAGSIVGSPTNRDSKELAIYNNATLGWLSDSGTLHDETILCSYQRVERLDYPVYRPVLILGPLADCVVDKLTNDFPNRYVRCEPELRHCSQATLEQELQDNVIVDYRRKGNYFECTAVAGIKNICDKNYHCILDISVSSIERLHRHQIYPIVLLIKFKSTKQIKELKDTRYPMDKVTAKAAKEMYEHGLKLEAEYKHQISAVIPGGVNITYMCTQVKASLDAEQSKSLWVPFQGLQL